MTLSTSESTSETLNILRLFFPSRILTISLVLLRVFAVSTRKKYKLNLFKGLSTAKICGMENWFPKMEQQYKEFFFFLYAKIGNEVESIKVAPC